MTLEDPFYVVKDEVFKALNKTRGLYIRWQEVSGCTSPEADWTSTELKNALRSIEWDLEDLDDTISIVEKNLIKFKIDYREIEDRRTFIEATKKEVQLMKVKMRINRNVDSDGTAREPLLAEEPERWPAAMPGGGGGAVVPPVGGAGVNRWRAPYHQYAPLHAPPPSPPLAAHDVQIQQIGASVSALKTVSKQIGHELDDQAVMLDDMHTELENADSKLDSTLKKVARVLHMNSDRRQCCAILVLFGLLGLILLLFIYL